MEILLDTANVENIRELMQFFPIDGITTNPSILSKATDDVHKTLSQLRDLAGPHKMVHAQVTAMDTLGMVEQAKYLSDFMGPNFHIKIPINIQGLRAVQLCKAAGLNVTVTAIFTPMQALLAAKAGADYVAPYVDRLDNITSDGASVVAEIMGLFTNYNLKTKVIAASFKNVQQIYNVSSCGAHAVTINEDLCQKLLFHPFTDKSIEDFYFDWTIKFGQKEIDQLIKEKQPR